MDGEMPFFFGSGGKKTKKWSMVPYFEFISQYLAEIIKKYWKLRTISDWKERISLATLIIEDLDTVLIGLGLDGFDLETEYKELNKLADQKSIINYVRNKMSEVFKKLKKEEYLEFIKVLDEY